MLKEFEIEHLLKDKAYIQSGTQALDSPRQYVKR